ncbi:MAG: electron transport complex subunit RsxA, partial [Clostridia bacterium]|nr:electron transport complex subunit RsxA [Clostridia bacterium]
GFTLVMIIMSGMREKMNCIKVNKSLSGFPISMIAAAFICMAFSIFAQIKI